jgi:segregation and condensation protein B
VETKQIVEAILFAANRSMTLKQIKQVFPELEQPDNDEIQRAIDAIIEDYRLRPVELKLVASGYRFQIKEAMSPWVARLFAEKPPRYSRALLETMAIIAYRQPVTRGDIEDIRGVSVSSTIMRTLLDREWVCVVGHKEVPGRPALYSTTKQLLDYFNLSSLSELPTLQEVEDLQPFVTSDSVSIQETSEKQETPNPAIETIGQQEITETLQ